VLVAPLNYDHEQRGLLQAFRGVFGEGATCTFDYLGLQRRGQSADVINQSFVSTAVAARPEWIWLQLQDTQVISAEAIRAVRTALPRTVITHWTGDCRPSVSAYLGSICRATHLTLVSSVGQLPMFREAGAEAARYLQIGLDWEEDVLGLPDWTPPFRVPDVVFCGNYYDSTFPEGSRERLGAVQALLAAGLDAGVVGSGWPHSVPVVGQCHVKQQHHVWTRARVALSINHFNGIERYYSDRQLIAMASGTPVVCRFVPGLDAEFAIGGSLLAFHDHAEMVAQVRSLLAHPEQASRIGSAGRAAVIRGHTWFHRLLDVMPDVLAVQARLA
jgi:hypothetical protein